MKLSSSIQSAMTTAPSPAITLTLTAIKTPVPAAKKGEPRIGLAALEGLEVDDAVGALLLPLTEVFPLTEAEFVGFAPLDELAPLVGELLAPLSEA